MPEPYRVERLYPSNATNVLQGETHICATFADHAAAEEYADWKNGDLIVLRRPMQYETCVRKRTGNKHHVMDFTGVSALAAEPYVLVAGPDVVGLMQRSLFDVLFDRLVPFPADGT